MICPQRGAIDSAITPDDGLQLAAMVTENPTGLQYRACTGVLAVLQMTNCHLHANLLRYLLSYYGNSTIFTSHDDTCNEVAAVVHFAELADIACDPIVHGCARPPDGLNLL
jgi:hypothetical protein